MSFFELVESLDSKGINKVVISGYKDNKEVGDKLLLIKVLLEDFKEGKIVLFLNGYFFIL